MFKVDHAKEPNSVYEDRHLKMTVIDGVLHLTYKGPLQIQEHHPVEFRQKRLKFLNGRILPTLAIVEDHLFLPRAARTTLRRIEFSDIKSPCVAIVVDSPLQKFMVNIYLKTIGSHSHTRLFLKKEDAIAWIKKNQG